MRSILQRECPDHPDYQADSPPRNLCPTCWTNRLLSGFGLGGNDNWEDFEQVMTEHTEAVLDMLGGTVLNQLLQSETHILEHEKGAE